MHGYPHPDVTANELSQIPVDKAHSELARILDAPWRIGDWGAGFAAGLHYNALLVSRLRERGVKIWGTEPTAAP